MVRTLAFGLRIAIVSMLVALAGCSLVPQARDGETLKPNQGLLAFYVDSNADLYLSYGEYAKESTFGSRWTEYMVGPKGKFAIKAGKKYYVVPVDAGDYMFSRLDIYPRFAWLQSTNRFKVEANKVTYIGHLRMHVTERGFNLGAADQELDMRTHLADAYPAYFKSMDLQKSVVQMNLR